jgi:hypothetical protein
VIMAKAKKAANAVIDFVTPKKASGALPSVQTTRMGDVGFDPRFDDRIKEQQRLNDLTTTVEKRASQEIPSIYLPDYEGYGYVSSMADRTAGGGSLIGINDVSLKRPVGLQAGQSYMFENPGQVWASGDTPTRAIMMQAAAAKALTGKNPLYLPHRMAPTGSDFATMTGETMLSYAESNMGRDAKKTLNSKIKEFIPNWKGVDSPKSIDQFRSQPDATRKAIHAMMDRDFRNEGGLGIGEARLSIADPEQLSAPVGYLMNVGKIFADKPLLQQSGHASYPRGVPGEGLGRINDERSLFELYPKTFPEEGKEKVIRPLLLDPKTALSEYNKLPDVVEARNITDPKAPSFDDTRALQMKPYYGILTEDVLRRMGYAQGGIVDSAPEEAIKNTITDPQAFKMLDMDLANLALMSQQRPRRMAEGGKMSKDEDLFALKPQPKPAVPTVRELVAEIGKSPSRYEAKYPAKDFTPLELQAYRLMQAAKATPDAGRYLESLNPYFDSQLKFDIGAGKEAGYVEPKVPNLAVVQQLQDVKNTIPHELTHTLQLGKGKGTELERDRQVMQRAKALPIETQKTMMPSDNRFENMKETWANINARAHEVNAAGGDFINSPEGRALFSTPEMQREYYTKSMPGVNSMTPSTGTFVANTSAPVDRSKQSYAQQALRALGFAQGGAVQRFDDGGEVSQDQMRYELDRANSPVMQATPRSPIQNAIGTFGGYMDKAGKFVSEAIAPTAEKHPVKHFLANMLLADSLKGAGTLMQDLTGTAREADEDNPVRGIIDKDWRKLSTSTAPLLDPRALDLAGFVTPVAKGATKLGQAGAKAITPFAKSTAEMAAELYGSGKMTGMVAPNAYMAEPTAPKPEKILAPATEQGFYSPTEAAALNLQRKTGNGQAFLNDLLKQENVRPDEIKAMGLDTFLKDKKNVTAAEVQDYIAQNKLRLGETVYGQSKPTVAPAVQSTDDFFNFDNLSDQIGDAIDPKNLPKPTKFDRYQLPGGKNYREVVITLPTEGRGLSEIELDKINRRLVDKGYDGLDEEQRAVAMRGGNEAMDMLQDLEDRVGIKTNDLMKTMAGGDPRTQYRSSHFDEPNILAHLRMSDRLTDGKKTLLVDEVQSDWHQAGKEKGYGPIMEKSVEAYYETKDGQRIPIGFGKTKEEAEANIDVGWKNMVDIKYETHERKIKEGVPNAPYKEDWYQLALRRAIKEAIDGGYDRVALPTGARVNERFSLTKQINEIHYSGSNLKAYDHNGKEVISQTGVRPEDLPSYVGKETANKLLEQPKQGTLRSLVGQDLEVGGEGNKKWYDEIYPGYLKKFGKKYGATVGSTTVDVRGKNEPLHYMDITPAMRREFSTGIHMKKGGKVSFASNVDAMRHELTKAK